MPEPTLQQVLNAIGELRADVMARIDRLQDGVNAIRDDIAVNFAAADRAIGKADSTRDEVAALGREVSGEVAPILWTGIGER